MMLQILFDQLFRHLPYRGTKVPPRPEMPTPVSLFYMRKLFKQLARRPTFDPPHDLARRHRRRTTHQNMYVILAHYPFHDPDLKRLTRLSYQLPYPLRYVSATQSKILYGYRTCIPCRTSVRAAYSRS